MGAALEYDYLEDIDPISGAPIITAVPLTVAAAKQGVPYNTFDNVLELFRPNNLREAWRVLRRNDPFDYQLEVADAIIFSAIQGLGWYFAVMISRQAGKNEISAFVEHYLLLYGFLTGTKVSGVKFAPVNKPQVQASKDRLKGADTPDSGGLAGSPLTRELYRMSDGYKFHIGPPRDTNKWAFLSINPAADVASQTAFTLLEGDEAQDIDTDKWERDAQPMGSFNNATTVFYGVAWTKSSHMYKAVEQAYAMESRLAKELGYRPKLVFKVDAYRVIASGNANYKKAFDNQVARLGIDHIAIQTQYLLNFIDSAGAFFNERQLEEVFNNTYTWQPGPRAGRRYVFSLDVAGESEDSTQIDVDIGAHKRDAQAMIIGELTERGEVVAVAGYYWVGEMHSRSREQVVQIIRHWNCIGGAVDATGIGESIAYWLVEQFPRKEVFAYKFKAEGDENKSKLGYLMYTYIAAGLFKVAQPPQYHDPEQRELREELHWQLKTLIREAKKKQKLNFFVPSSAKPRKLGHVPHDDLAMASFLLVYAAQQIKDPSKRKAVAVDRRDLKRGRR